MGGKRTKKKQVQVRTIATRSTPCATPSSPSSAVAKDAHSNGVSAPEGLCERSVGDDAVSHVFVKGGCGKICRHAEKGVNIEKLSALLGKSKALLTQCQDCAKDGKAGTNKNSKGRSVRKKLVQNSSAHTGGHQAIKWVCLACGHVGCGAISAPRQSHSSEKSAEREKKALENANEGGSPTGHASKHSLCAKHPLAMQCGEELVCWCFICNAAVEYCFPAVVSSQLDSVVEGSKEPVTHSSPGTGILQQVAKLVCDKLEKEGVFFKDPVFVDQTDKTVKASIGGVRNPSPADNFRLIPNGHCSGSQRKRVVKGLMNLGNTCFFNSVMQNLLALDLLRDYFSQDSQFTEGPLTSALRKLYLETNCDGQSISKAPGHADMSGSEFGIKKVGKGRLAWESGGGAYNPRSLFGAICAKAPRFRGFQEQDSHELLRCLLEGLQLEERNAKGTVGGYNKVAGSATSSSQLDAGAGDEPESLDRGSEHGDAEKSDVATQTSTLVETFFGGQLSSTVRCCECGHSSIVYEPFLDLSLQIPARRVVKKGQAQSRQEASSSALGGRSEKELSQRAVRSTKMIQKVGLLETSNTNCQAGAESMRESAEASSSASIENKSCSPEVSSSGPTVPNCSFGAGRSDLSGAKSCEVDPLHDFGWLDFVGGGIQSAEGLLQDSQNETSLVADAQNSMQDTALKNASQSLSSAESCTVPSPKDVQGGEEFIGELLLNNLSDAASVVPKDDLPPKKCLPDSAGVDVHQDIQVEFPISIPGGKHERSTAEFNNEDEPLHLASGVLLLPYEHLQLPNKSTAKSRPEGAEIADCNLTESCCSLPGEDKDTTSSLLVEQDGGEFDGFSQLFEEDESSPEKDQTGEVREGGQGSLDSRWDGETENFAQGESDLIATGPQKLIEHKDAVQPMSLEGCLTDFTKSELLFGENAWACESCFRHFKENASPLASDNEGNKTVSNFCMKGVSSNAVVGSLAR